MGLARVILVWITETYRLIALQIAQISDKSFSRLPDQAVREQSHFYDIIVNDNHLVEYSFELATNGYNILPDTQ